VFRTLKYATPHLEQSRGHVLVVASALSFMPLAGMASYAARKAAVEILTLTLAWPWTRRFAAKAVPALEREVEALGRHDQLVPGADDLPA